jgi:hypothetical protein
MARLFAGRPQRTGGRLTKQNLWAEAEVSRATMNRAGSILAEWDAHVAEHGSATRGETRRDEEIRELRRKLAEAKAANTVLRRRRRAVAGKLSGCQARGRKGRWKPSRERDHRTRYGGGRWLVWCFGGVPSRWRPP